VHLICSLAGHRAAARTIYNAGHHFGRCGRCHVDMIERDGVWKIAPRGFRVVWKATPDTEPEGASVPQPIEQRSALSAQEDELVLDVRHDDRRGFGDRRGRSGPGVPAYLAGRDRRRRARRAFGKRAAFTTPDAAE
jgi:hypothetical protein